MNTSRNPEKAEGDLESVMDQIKEGIRSGKYSLQELQSAVMEKTKEAARSTDQYVHENPWQVIGMAAAVGLVVGLLVYRR
jgi:ElaB/YqjD/DUF883 family membrane-anchored ribosome-binding protein